MVIDTVNNFFGQLYASVCDPWDGDVHVTPFTIGSPFVYSARNLAFDQPAKATAAPGAPAKSRFGHVKDMLLAGNRSWSIGTPEHNYWDTPTNGATNGWIIYQQ